jgi:hypothetical protein
MPWWSDPSGALASEFALQVYDSLGMGSHLGSGPLFTYLYDADSSTLEGWSQSITDPDAQDIQTLAVNEIIKYAIINFTPQPVPSPLPFMGAIGTFRASRRLRKRMLELNETRSPDSDSEKSPAHRQPWQDKRSQFAMAPLVLRPFELRRTSASVGMVGAKLLASDNESGAYLAPEAR